MGKLTATSSRAPVAPARAPNGKPRIALVVHDVDSQRHGGMERVCTELLLRASDEVDFTVISSWLSPDLRGLVKWRRVPVIRRPMPLKFLLYFAGAGLLLRGSRYDLVNSVGAIVPNRVDLASVHHCHAGFRANTGHIAPPGTSAVRRLNIAANRLLALAAERWCYRRSRVRVLAAVSDEVGEEVARHYPGVEVLTTPNGVDLDGFAPDPEVRRSVRQMQGVDDTQVIALFVGGDWPLKGLELAIRGLAVAERQSGEPVRLWVVGTGNERRYRAVAEASGLSDRVNFLGYQPHVEQYYKAADIFVFPSLYEAFPLVALEAAACGLAIVATSVGGIRSLIGADECGLLVERTPESIGTAIAKLATDHELRSRLAAAGRRRASEYTWRRSVTSVLDVYRRLLGGDVPDAAQRTAELGELPQVAR